MPAIATFPTFLRFPLGGARQLLERVLRAGGQMNHLGGGASMEPLAAQVVVSNWWESGGATGCVAAYQPKGAASLAASYVNLANAGTYNAVPVSAPSLGASGWGFNGTTNYMTTGITPGDNWSALVQFSDETGTVVSIPFGSVAGDFTKRFCIALYLDGQNYTIYQHQAQTVTQPVMTGGNVGFAGQQGYRNGVADGAAMATNAGTYYPIFIGAWNYAGSPIFFAKQNMQALVFYNTVLTAPQMLAVATAMAAL